MGWKLLDGFMGCILHQPQASRRNRQMLEEHGYEPEPASASIFRLSSSSKSLYKQEDEPERSKEEKQVIITEGPKEGNRHKYKNNKLHGGPVNEELIAKEKQEHDPSVRIAPSKALKGEETASGWPIWLTTILQDALDGWTPRSAESYEKLDKIGQGTYSNVYKARDRTTGKIVALKKVRFDTSEQESVRFMAREIRILCRLDHPNVVKLEGLANSRMQYSLYLVFEYMESDLTSIITRPDVKLTEPQVKCYMQQLLQGLEHCQEKGVLHRDIKGSNLLVDKNGVLKIADFGLGTFFKPYDKKPLTNRVVTLWYRPPELLLGVTEYGVGIDLWSAGCLLGELFTGKPIMPGRTEVEQLHKIFKLCGSPSEDYWKKIKAPNTAMFKPQHSYKRNLAETFKDLPASALSLMNMLLALDPADRGTASKALKTEFFHTDPLPCDPLDLPKFPQAKDHDTIAPRKERRHRRNGHKNHISRNRREQSIIKNEQEGIQEIIEEKPSNSISNNLLGESNSIRISPDHSWSASSSSSKNQNQNRGYSQAPSPKTKKSPNPRLGGQGLLARTNTNLAITRKPQFHSSRKQHISLDDNSPLKIFEETR